MITRFWVTRLLACLLFVCSRGAAALDVPLGVTNQGSTGLSSQPVTTGVPFAKGALTDPSGVRLLKDGSEIPLQTLRTARWPDGSVRWLLLDFQSDLPAGATTSLVLRTEPPVSPLGAIPVTLDASTLTVASLTAGAAFTFDRSQLDVLGNVFEVVSGGETYRAVPDPSSWTIEESGSMKVVARVEGGWRSTSSSSALRDSLIRFRARLFFYRDRPEIRVQVTFRNNNGFGWISEFPRAADLTLTDARFGVSLLPSGGSYVFGSGSERTWTVLVSAGASSIEDSRYDANGDLATGFSPPRPLALATPDYYASTRAWGEVVTPRTNLSSELQADHDLFERFLRAQVSADALEDPPGLAGGTVWSNLAPELATWNNYGDQSWGGDTGRWSGNHYDWSYGSFLQLMRTGNLDFANSARVFAAHEIDLEIYHTAADGTAFNYQKNWESRPSHDNPGNDFGGGRPSHTWSQGYALYWLLCGEPRGRDGYEEILEGVRQYVYESFNDNGYVNTSEIRIQGWLTENLMTLWRIDPDSVLETTSFGQKTVTQAMRDVLQNVFDRESAAGGNGFVIPGDDSPAANERQTLQNLYFVEPALKAYREVFSGSDPAYAAELLALIRRLTDFIISVTQGGTSQEGQYMPRQIPFVVNTNLSIQVEGQIPYLLMAANAAGFLYTQTGQESYLTYARAAFSDYVRYVGATGGDTFVDPSIRTATSYVSNVYQETASKVWGWLLRYGQYYLEAETGQVVADGEAPIVAITGPKAKKRVKRGFRLKGTASDNIGVSRVEVQVSGGAWVVATGTTSWTYKVPKSRRRRLTVAARAIDTAGNVSLSVTRTVKVR